MTKPDELEILAYVARQHDLYCVHARCAAEAIARSKRLAEASRDAIAECRRALQSAGGPRPAS